MLPLGSGVTGLRRILPSEPLEAWRSFPCWRLWQKFRGLFSTEVRTSDARVITRCSFRCHREGVTVKLVKLMAVPPRVVIPTLPLLAPAGTVTVTLVSELTVKLVANTPPKVTFVV